MKDDFLKQVTSKLDGLAQHHKNKPVVKGVCHRHARVIQHAETACVRAHKPCLDSACSCFILFKRVSEGLPGFCIRPSETQATIRSRQLSDGLQPT